MRKYLRKFILSVVVISFLVGATIKPSDAAMPAKAKAMLAMAGYGVAGGALLGFASMAFGAQPRAIAQGASLGLYAGILFGAYIIASYEYQQAYPAGSYEENASPYSGEDDLKEGDGGDSGYDDQEAQRWSGPNDSLQFRFLQRGSRVNKIPAVHFNLINFNF